jgi:hypothetical protein
MFFLMGVGVPLVALIVAGVLAVRSARPLPWTLAAIVAGIATGEGFSAALIACGDEYPCQPLDEAPALFMVTWLACAAFLLGALIGLLIHTARQHQRDRH